MAPKRKSSKPGKKHKIILIAHSMHRIWRSLLLADLIAWLVWFLAPYSGIVYLMPPNDIYLFYSGLGLFALMALVFLVRKRGYVQARTKFVLLQAPFFRHRIRYEDIANVRMLPLRQVYKGVNLSWSARRFLMPYFTQTAAVLLLKRYSTATWLLRILVPKYLILPKGKGFLLPIKDYVGFNTEIDSRLSDTRDPHIPGAQQTQPSDEDEFSGYFNSSNG